jgi:penicillin-binding protein 1A
VAELRAPNGEALALAPPVAQRRVMDAEEAYLITSLLESVVQSGSGRQALSIGHPVAGKTGTTNEVKDAWFVGYSTDLSVAVWVGFDDTLPLGERESGARTALPAFVDFMTAALAGRPHTEFPRPPGVLVASIDPETGLLPRFGQSNALAEVFLDGTVPERTAPDPLPEPLPDRGEEMPYKPDLGESHEPPP